MVTEADYMRAVESEGFRQEFLNTIDLGETGHYIRRVVYVPKNTVEGRYETLMMTVPSFLAKWGIRRTRSKVRVYPAAFSEKYSPYLADFLGVLLDHEALHAKESYETPKEKPDPVWGHQHGSLEEMDIRKARRELRAIRTELENADLRGRSRVARDKLKGMRARYEKELDFNEHMLRWHGERVKRILGEHRTGEP